METNGQKNKEVQAQACLTSSSNLSNNCELSQAVTGLDHTTNSLQSQEKNVESLQNSENNSSVESVESIESIATRIFNGDIVAIEKNDSGNVGIGQADVKPVETESLQRENARNVNQVGAEVVAIEQAAVKSVGLEQKDSVGIVLPKQKVSQTVETEDEQAYDVVTIATKEYPTYEKFLKEQSENIYCVIKDVATDWVKDCSVRYGYGVTDFIPDFYSEAPQYLTGKKLESIILQWQQPKSLEGKYGVPPVHLRLTYIRHHDPHTTKAFDQDCAAVIHDMYEQWKADNTQNIPITVETYRQYRHAFECKKTPEQIAEEKRQRELKEAKLNASRLTKYQYWQECFDRGFIEVDPPANGYFAEKFLIRFYGINLDSVRYCIDDKGVFFCKDCFKNEDGTVRKRYNVVVCKLSNFDGASCGWQVLLHDVEDIQKAKAAGLATKKIYIHPDHSKSGSFIPIGATPLISQLSKNHVFFTSEGLASILSPYLIIEKDSPENWCFPLEFQSVFCQENPSDVVFHFLSGIDCGNLPHVWAMIRNCYGDDCRIINFADDDCLEMAINGHGDLVPKRNSGRETALKGQQYGVISIFPEFSQCGLDFETRVKYHAKDFNDLHRYCELAKVRSTMLESIKAALQTPQPTPRATASEPTPQPTPEAQATPYEATEAAPEKKDSLDIPKSQFVDDVNDEFQYQLFDTILARLKNIEDRLLAFVSAPTGLGKTYALVALALYYYSKGVPSILHFPTKENVYLALEYAQKILTEQPNDFPNVSINDVENVESGRKLDSDETPSKRTKRSRNYKGIILTSYGYIGRKGYSQHGYFCYHEMIENRVAIYDEMQHLLHALNIQIPLVERYQHIGDSCQHVKNCPKSARKGDCRSCEIAWKRLDPHPITNIRNFYPSFSYNTLETYKKIEDAPIDFGLKLNEFGEIISAPAEVTSTLSSLLCDMQLYEQVHKTLFCRYLEQNLHDVGIIPAEGGTIQDFIQSLLATLINPHVRIEYPIIKETEQPISQIEIAQMMEGPNFDEKKIQFPKLPCGVPALCGVDTFFLQQLRGMTVTRTIKGEKKQVTYHGAKAAIFASATMPPVLVDHIQDTLEEGGRFSPAIKVKCKEIPYRFNVPIISTSKEFSIDTIEEILYACLKLKISPLIVMQKKAAYYDLKNRISSKRAEQVTFFEDGEFFEDTKFSHKRKTQDSQVLALVTYARSAIMTGENFPEYDLLIIDCSLFSPMLTLQELQPGMNEHQRQQVMFTEIQNILTQGVGRILRSNEPRRTGQTVFDPKRKLVLLHGLPEGLKFDIDENLRNPATYKHIQETWYDKLKKNMTASIVDTITKMLSGLDPIDYDKLATQKTAAKPTNQVTPSQRHLTKTPEGQQAKELAKAAEAAKQVEAEFKKIVSAKQLGLTYREIHRKFHLDRNPELTIKTRQLFDMPLDAD